jgi:periplasmic divalent cation tolerance protein
MTTDVRAVLISAPDEETSETLARALVGERLAACVNVVPGIVSFYRWQGSMHRDPEVLLIAKTSSARVDSLRARVVELHPYDVPEVVVLPVEQGHLPYLDWVRAEVGG